MVSHVIQAKEAAEAAAAAAGGKASADLAAAKRQAAAMQDSLIMQTEQLNALQVASTCAHLKLSILK